MALSSEHVTCRMDETSGHNSDVVVKTDDKCKCNCHTSVKILTAISVISCVVCLICMFTLLYFIFINKNNIQSNIQSWNDNKKLPDSSRNPDDTVAPMSIVDDLDQIKRYERAPDGKTNKKGKGNKRRKCKCRGKRGKRGADGPPGADGPQGPPGEPAKPLMAAHYASNFENNEKKEFREGKKCIELSGKTVCRNRTSIMPKNESLKGLLTFPSTDSKYDFLYPAEWYDEKHGPLMQNKNSVFIVQKTGIYLIYSTVSTHYFDAKLLLAQTIQINGDTKFRCLDGIDYVKNQNPTLNRRHKTCSVSGVTRLLKGDEIEVQNVFHDVTIDITKDRTYFGVVLLHD